MQIRLGNEGWLAALLRAEADIFSDAWGEAALLSHLGASTSRTLIAEEDGALCGYLLGSVIPPEGEVYRIAVLPKARRRGVGEALLSAFLKEVPTCFLEVRESNAPARAFYEKHGFCLIARRCGYYTHPKEDACIYKKEG